MFILWPLKLAMRAISLLFTAMVLFFIFSGVQVILYSRLHEGTTHLHPASTIVVIGGAMNKSAATPDLRGRLSEALDCYRAHLAPSIIVTGVAPLGKPNVTSFETTWFEQHGVPRAVLRQAVGSNTAAQLQLAGEEMGTARSAIIVTDALAAFWTAKDAAHNDISAQMAPATNSEIPAYRLATTVLSQAGAIAVGRIVGFNRIFWV